MRLMPIRWWYMPKPRPKAGSRGISAFLIEKDDEGFSIGQKIDKVGMRGSPTAELVFNDCFIPEDRIMGPLHGGVGVLMSGLDYERVVLAWFAAWRDAGLPGRGVLPYVRERKQFGKAIGSFQLMQGKGCRHVCRAQFGAVSYVYNVARACDAGQTTRFDAAGAILLASESAVKVAGEAIQALGGAGYTKDWPVERLLARRQAARYWCRHQRNPPHADRAGTDRGGMSAPVQSLASSRATGIVGTEPAQAVMERYIRAAMTFADVAALDRPLHCPTS